MFLDSCNYMHCLPNIYCLKYSDKSFGYCVTNFRIILSFVVLLYIAKLKGKCLMLLCQEL